MVRIGGRQAGNPSELPKMALTLILPRFWDYVEGRGKKKIP